MPLTAVHHAVVSMPALPHGHGWAMLGSAIRGLPAEAEMRLNAAAERILRRRYGYVRPVGEETNPVLNTPTPPFDLDQAEGGRGEVAKILGV